MHRDGTVHATLRCFCLPVSHIMNLWCNYHGGKKETRRLLINRRSNNSSENIAEQTNDKRTSDIFFYVWFLR